MKELIEKFLDYLEKVATRNTVLAYKVDLGQFDRFLRSYPKGVTLEEGDQRTIIDYFNSLKRARYSNSSINRKFAALKSFFNYLTAKGILKVNPIEEMVYPERVGKVRPQILTIEEIAELLEMPGRSSKPEATRDSAMMELLYGTGVQVTELISLDINIVNLDPSSPYIKVKHDGKERVIPIPPRAVQALSQYLKEVRPIFVGEKIEKALFLNLRGERITRQGFWVKLRKYAKQVGLEGKVTPRTLRHSFAAHQLESGMPLKELQQRLGHAYPETTSKYRGIL